jgi:predicted HTH transcriptional regulator
MISQSLRDRCEPPIGPEVRRVLLEEKPVYVVLIPKSKNKPPMLKGIGVVYIRVAATDKPATRYELEELFGQDQERLGPP